jgi:hypothetical protein
MGGARYLTGPSAFPPPRSEGLGPRLVVTRRRGLFSLRSQHAETAISCQPRWPRGLHYPALWARAIPCKERRGEKDLAASRTARVLVGL